MNFRFAPGRGSATASSAMVATSQMTSTLAGLEILRSGGNAVDAAIAAAACLCVAEPMSNGLGGDCFALIWDGQQIHGLDAGGAAPLSAPSAPPESWGPNSIVVPAVVAGWAELNARFGRLGLDRCLQASIDIADSGVAAGANTANAWLKARQAPQQFGEAPKTGEVFRLDGLAGSLRVIADQGPSEFYLGKIGEAIVASSWLEPEDLAAAQAKWVTPLSIRYRGIDVFEMPPPTQGIAALEGLGILEQLGEATPANQVRAIALALEDARKRVRDGADVSDLLDPQFLQRRSLENPTIAPEPSGGTVYLCVVDSDGMAVSFIQSLYEQFGSGVVVPGTGIVLNNRASCFSVNGVVQPGRRPYHTTIPAMLMDGGRLRGPVGVMGGFIQAQAHVQLISALIDRGLDPQEALDLPRFRLDQDAIRLEEGLWDRSSEFTRSGHRVILDDNRLVFGGGQAIQILDGRILGGSDARKDGFAAGF